MSFLRAIQNLSFLFQNVFHKNGQLADSTVWDNNVLNTPAAVSLIIVADIFVPQRCRVPMCTVSTEETTLKDPPCIWQTSLRGTPQTGSEREGLRLMTEMAQLLRGDPGMD